MNKFIETAATVALTASTSVFIPSVANAQDNIINAGAVSPQPKQKKKSDAELLCESVQSISKDLCIKILECWGDIVIVEITDWYVVLRNEQLILNWDQELCVKKKLINVKQGDELRS